MNARGFLLAEETLKIIIAVISISFLVYFLASLYVSNKDAKDLELATASLQHLTEELSKNVGKVEIYNPESGLTNWQIAFFDSSRNEYIPDSCKNLGWDNCVCICGVGITSLSDKKSVSFCDSKGVCQKLDKSYEVVNNGDYSFKLNNLPMTLEIKEGKITRK